jgi:hypothetical protein
MLPEPPWDPLLESYWAPSVPVPGADHMSSGTCLRVGDSIQNAVCSSPGGLRLG